MKCAKCGGTRDTAEHGLRHGLTVEDNGSIGGQTACGDYHQWTKPVMFENKHIVVFDDGSFMPPPPLYIQTERRHPSNWALVRRAMRAQELGMDVKIPEYSFAPPTDAPVVGSLEYIKMRLERAHASACFQRNVVVGLVVKDWDYSSYGYEPTPVFGEDEKTEDAFAPLFPDDVPLAWYDKTRWMSVRVVTDDYKEVVTARLRGSGGSGTLEGSRAEADRYSLPADVVLKLRALSDTRNREMDARRAAQVEKERKELAEEFGL